METKQAPANKCILEDADLNDAEFVKRLKWIGMDTEENRRLIEEGSLLFFSEPWALEGTVVFDVKNNECIVVEHRSI